jgi:hypothetical protein
VKIQTLSQLGGGVGGGASIECCSKRLLDPSFRLRQEYLQLLEEAMDEFVKKEGFKNIEECYAEVERQVHDDTKRHEEEMKKLYAHLQAIQAQYAAEAKGGSTDAKGGMADDKDAKGEGMVAIPMVVLFQPITLEKLLDMVLNLSEYTTFSLMMRMKVTQLKMWKILEAQAKEVASKPTSVDLCQASPLCLLHSKRIVNPKLSFCPQP